MNKIVIVFFILFLIIAIVLGLNAIREDIQIGSRASNVSCPPQTLPENKTCPEGLKIELVKDAEGCYVFTCQ